MEEVGGKEGRGVERERENGREGSIEDGEKEEEWWKMVEEEQEERKKCGGKEEVDGGDREGGIGEKGGN